MEAPQGPENVNPQVVLVTGKVASAGSKARVRMTNKRLLVVLATLNVNQHLVKKFFTYGQKMKTCIELHALLLAQARIVEKDKDSCDQEQKLPSADTNTGHGVDAADTEVDRDLRAEIESLVLHKQELEAEKRELASEKENITKLGGLIESEACRRLFNHEKRGRGKSKRNKEEGRDDDDDDDHHEEDDAQVPIVVHARMHVPVTPVVAGGGR
jgi:hypothetical protein